MNCVNHSGRESVSFCQVCGRPLCGECVRKVGAAVYCEQDLAVMLGQSAASGAVPPPPSAGAVPPLSGSPANPGLAALLGFIPGVGAMYNGQFAKGLIHLGVFAVLCSIADDHSIFALFIMGWVFYQVIEAYQTAVARRDGKPLPNPLGLNDVGARFGSSRGSWFQQGWTGATPPPPPAAAADPAAAATDAGAQGANPYTNPYGTTSGYGAANPYANAYSYPPPPPVDYSTVPPPVAGGWIGQNIPGGAIWLIGLGVLFMVGTIRPFSFIRAGFIWPFIFIAWGVWKYVRTYQTSLQFAPNDGTATHQFFQLQALRKSGWLVLVGVLWLLDELHVLSWGASWPFFLIFVGLLAIADHYTGQQMAREAYVPPVVPPAYEASTGSESSTAIVPVTRVPEHEEEGR